MGSRRLGSIWTIAGLAILVATAAGACTPDNGGLKSASGPGGSAFKDEGSVACQADKDCGVGETCANNVCQMKRCGEPNYRSQAPLGTIGYFKRDREVVVAETDSIPGASLGSFDAQSNALVRMANAAWTSATAPVVDVAGGNLTGTRPESVALAIAGAKSITVKAQTGDIVIPLGFVPVAVAAGDVDGDGTDEVLALSDTGTVSACKASTKTCVSVTAPVPVLPTDLAAGDLDGDGYAEAVVLAGKTLAVINFDSERTGHKKTASVEAPKTLTRIAMGDLDADGKDDLVGLEDGWTGDSVHLIDIGEETATIRTTANVANGARDVAVGSTGADQMTLAVLGGSKNVDMFAFDAGALKSTFTATLAGTNSPKRLTLADVDGDSPTRSVRGTPKLVPGKVVPIAVLSLPPYSRTYSEGESSASVGATESKETGAIKTVILGANVGIALGGELGPIVEAEVSATVGREWWSIDTNTRGISIGGSFEVEAKPQKDGFASGAVMLGCACYHQYEYVIDDPRRVLGPDVDGKIMSVFVPVGGQTSVWSTRRYNALAEALGTLPKINIPHRLGEVESYPSTPKTLDGAPIPADDMVFKKPPTFRTSDVASVDFELTASEGEASEKHVYDSLTLGAEFGAFGVTVSGEVSATLGKGYSVAIGRDTTFSGHVPPLRNDPDTPEDEFGLYGYSFTPIVYRHRYTDSERKPGAFYVLTYAVSK